MHSADDSCSAMRTNKKAVGVNHPRLCKTLYSTDVCSTAGLLYRDNLELYLRATRCFGSYCVADFVVHEYFSHAGQV